MKKFLLFTFISIAFSSNAQCWKSVSAGESHAMGIKTDGTLWGWGYSGSLGLLGNSQGFPSTAPYQAGTATDWKEVYAGNSHSFALKNNGTLWAWGSNYKGKLGTGAGVTISLVPVQIGTSNWKMVRAGSNHSIGIKVEGTLWAWGGNEKATLGDGTFVDKAVPTQISTTTNWKTVSCNQSRNIAVKEDGTLWVWGMNSPFLGVENMGSGTAYITVPTQVGTETNWKTAVAGFGHFIALKNDNTLWAWGSNDTGQLGIGAASSSFSPAQVGTATDWAFIETDLKSSFGIKTDGTLWAWGENLHGNLGNGTLTNLLIPTQITTNSDWKMMGSSFFFSNALKTDGSLYSWGLNQWGNLGDGTYENQLSPELINTCALSTSDYTKNKINVFPNPVINQLFLDSPEAQTYQIYSILGVKISEGVISVGSSIDCSGLTSAVYLLNLVDSQGTNRTVKFIKQ